MTGKRNPAVLVIGAGMTGILAVIKLRASGITDITVLEKKDRIGGTWRENTYPGVACDVPSHMYSYSFEPNPDWSSFFAGGAEIRQYFENVSQKYDVLRHIQFGQEVAESRYDNGKWYVATAAGDQYVADFVICATGILHHPAFPDIPGIDDFGGQMFHTAEWKHDVAIDSRCRVGVIGTGSTAAQAIPELIETGANVSVFQRTPQWVLPLANFRFPGFVKKLAARSALAQKVLRNIPVFIMEHLFTKAVTGHFLQKKLLEFLCKANLRLNVRDANLRQRLTPDYQVGCKRVIVNTSFYKGIQKDNASLVTSGIKHITRDGVITADGKSHDLDVLILSTGFNPTAYMRPMNMTGRDGVSINDAWSTQIDCYRSVLLPDFPNFFLMLGPHTPIGNFSVIAMSEVQLDYVLKVIDQWRDGRFDTVEPKRQAIADFRAYVKEGLKSTAWVGGCQSWYLDSQGDPILWPYTWQQWVDEMAEPDVNDLVLDVVDRSASSKRGETAA